MSNALFIAWHDVRHQLRQGSTLLWVLVMPPIFFYFIGTVTGGFSGGATGAAATPLVVEAENPGFLRDQVDLRLRDNGFVPEWVTAVAPDDRGELPRRRLRIDADFSRRVAAGEQVTASYETRASALAREYEEIRIQRSLYTVLADVVVADAVDDTALSPESLAKLNAAERIWRLEVRAAGQRLVIPTGFEQSIPGILVMFTLLVLLTSGGSMLVLEREQGLLRRLASAPISRAEVVAGKWGGRMVLAAVQVGVALLVGTYLFRMDWGPDPGMVVVVLAAWAAFCASAGLLIGGLAATEGQATGLGVLIANVLAALGGCWWPIEVTPEWMQALQRLLPTGWTMNALHELISFQAGATAAMTETVLLLLAAVAAGLLAINRFRYE